MNRLFQKHKGKHALVCGTGPSLEAVAAEATTVDLVIGVNAAPSRIECLYTVVTDAPEAYPPEKLDQVLVPARGTLLASASAAHRWRERAPETITWQWYREPHKVHPSAFRMAQVQKIPSFDGTPFSAAALACWMGCRRVTLAGVDYTGDHPWARPAKRERLEAGWRWLVEVLELHGCLLRQGSRESTLEAVPLAW